MRRCIGKILLLALFIVVLVSLNFAQQTIKVGLVNSMEVLDKSAEGKRVITRLQEKDKSNQDKLSKLDEDIRKLETKLSTQRLTLTDDALMQLSSDIDRKRTERKRFAEDSLREIQELRARLFNKLQNELLPIIEQLGKEKNLYIIFDLAKSGAIYFNPSINFTAEVIKRYDASKAPKK